MRTQGLLSPHRGRQGEMKAHEGTIVTSMWGNASCDGANQLRCPVFRNLAEVRAAVAAFVGALEARQQYELRHAA